MASNRRALSSLFGAGPGFAQTRPTEEVRLEDLNTMPKKKYVLFRSSNDPGTDYYGRHLAELGRSIGGPART